MQEIDINRFKLLKSYRDEGSPFDGPGYVFFIEDSTTKTISMAKVYDDISLDDFENRNELP